MNFLPLRNRKFKNYIFLFIFDIVFDTFAKTADGMSLILFNRQSGRGILFILIQKSTSGTSRRDGPSCSLGLLKIIVQLVQFNKKELHKTIT